MIEQLLKQLDGCFNNIQEAKSNVFGSVQQLNNGIPECFYDDDQRLLGFKWILKERSDAFVHSFESSHPGTDDILHRLIEVPYELF